MPGRPTRQGIDYFHLDVGFFEDIKVRKIMKACGSNAPSILLGLVCECYRDKGYYICLDEDVTFLTAERFGCSYGFVSEVVLQACRVGFFDPELFAQYGVLTSRGIQKRYFRVVKDANRANVEVDGRLLLIEIEKYDFKKGVISDLRKVSSTDNSVSSTENSVSSTENGQSKVKKSKVKKEIGADKPPAPAKPVKMFVPPTLEEVAEYCTRRGNSINPQRFLDYFEESGWVDSKGNKVKNWKQKIITWEGRELSATLASTQSAKGRQRKSLYDSFKESED